MKALAALVILCVPLALTRAVYGWLVGAVEQEQAVRVALSRRHPPEPARPGWCDDCGRSYIDHATHERIAHIAAQTGPDDWT